LYVDPSLFSFQNNKWRLKSATYFL
jgi:hypothetical protein